MDDLIIETHGLCKSYGELEAVTDLNLHVYRGDVYGFLGPNGAGKSTSIRMMLTLINPTAGRITVLGKDLHRHRKEVLSKVGSIVEKPDFYKYLSAKKNLEIFASLNGISISELKIMELIELVGLKGRENDKVKGYSHGMRQRLGIAQTLINDPELIILDEPTTGLDPQGIIDIRNLISYLQKEKGKTIVLSSHILSEIELISNRMVIINKGRAVIEGEVNNLLNQKELIVRFVVDDRAAALNLLSSTKWYSKIDLRDTSALTLLLSAGEVPELNAWLVNNGVGVRGIDSKRKLEDYFLKLISN